MEVIVISKEDFEKMKDSFLKEITNVILTGRADPPKSWIRTSEVRKILKVSSSTVQNLRNSGLLPFSKIKGSIYYKISDVEKLFEINCNRNNQ